MHEALVAFLDLLLLWVWSRSALFWFSLAIIAAGCLGMIGNLFEPSTP